LAFDAFAAIGALGLIVCQPIAVIVLAVADLYAGANFPRAAKIGIFTFFLAGFTLSLIALASRGLFAFGGALVIFSFHVVINGTVAIVILAIADFRGGPLSPFTVQLPVFTNS
jgi:hypothetical protein